MYLEVGERDFSIALWAWDKSVYTLLGTVFGKVSAQNLMCAAVLWTRHTGI